MLEGIIVGNPTRLRIWTLHLESLAEKHVPQALSHRHMSNFEDDVATQLTGALQTIYSRGQETPEERDVDEPFRATNGEKTR